VNFHPTVRSLVLNGMRSSSDHDPAPGWARRTGATTD
jgi:hypothetical protein